MKRVKMYSPDGKTTIEVLPYKVEEMEEKGWTKQLKKQTKEVSK